MNTIGEIIVENAAGTPADEMPALCAEAASEVTGIDMSRIAEWIPADAEDFVAETIEAIQRFSHDGPGEYNFIRVAGTGEVIAHDRFGNPIYCGQEIVAVSAGQLVSYIAHRKIADCIAVKSTIDGVRLVSDRWFKTTDVVAVSRVCG